MMCQSFTKNYFLFLAKMCTLQTIESSAKQFMGRGNSSTLIACVNFVDLAGSERASQTQSAGMRLKEGSHINRSLLTLGKVIRQLSKGGNGHIPYRDSKLTRILQSSLGGNARTAIICTMSPAQCHIEQSRNTLLFANCAKNVVTNAQVNAVMSDKVLVKHLQRELARLENELKSPGSASCSTHAEVLREKDELIKQLEEQLKELMEQRDTVQSQLDNFRRVASDGNIDDRTTRRWDEHNRSSDSLPRNVSEDLLSSSDTYDAAYEDQDDLGSKALDASHDCNGHHHDPKIPKGPTEPHQQTMGSVLTRSKSCRASFMVIPNSWFDDSMDMKMTEPGDIFKYAPIRPEKVRRSLYPENGDCQNDLSLDCSVASGGVAPDTVVDKNTCNDEEESAINDIRCIREVKEKVEECRTSQLEGNQYIITEDFSDIKSAKDVGTDISMATVDSPSRWAINFEKKQKEIIELWHECNVSIVHRTYFFLLFKGDKADNIYLEVEHRRLSFIKGSFSTGFETSATITSSLRNLRHERDMLYRQMLKKLHHLERESLYTKWGIDLNSKQRRLQLSRRIWTQTDMDHVRESAALVAKLVEHLEKGQAIKEMFGLSFTLNPRADRRSFSWQ
ncbi:hypothetical protein SEVIR_2G449800v4 [Setaria viridis]